MIVGVLGSGRAGCACARLLASAGHEVLISNRRGVSSLAGVVAQLPGNVAASSAASAVDDAEVVLLAVPWPQITALPPAEAFAGRIVIDVTNPICPDGPADLGGHASSSVVRELVGAGRLVKAFNSLPLSSLAMPVVAGPDGPPVVPMCGDDEGAKAVVAGLIGGCGFAPFDLGSLQHGSELQEPGGPFFGRVLSVPSAERLARAAARCSFDW